MNTFWVQRRFFYHRIVSRIFNEDFLTRTVSRIFNEDFQSSHEQITATGGFFPFVRRIQQRSTTKNKEIKQFVHYFDFDWIPLFQPGASEVGAAREAAAAAARPRPRRRARLEDHVRALKSRTFPEGKCFLRSEL